MSLGYSFPALVGAGVGRGIVSHGFMSGAIEGIVVAVCLDGSVRVSVYESGDVAVEPELAGEVQTSASLSGTVRVGSTLDGDVMERIELAGRARGRC